MRLVYSALTSLLAAAASAVKYEQYILAPSSRTLHPVSVHQVNGSVTNAGSLTGDDVRSATFDGVSAVTYDFGKNIAGIVTVEVANSDADQFIGVTFTESSLWISGIGCDATADAGIDEPLWFEVDGSGSYTADPKHQRGGFRYMSLVHNTTGSVEVQQITVQFTPQPDLAEDQLRDYSGWFHCNDELINRIWYAGAYTNQLCTIDPHYGNALVHIGKINSTQKGDDTGPDTWWSNTTITNGTSCLVDGAKRDRLVWAGDMSIAVPAITVATYDLISVENSLSSLFGLQNTSNGQLPYAGVGFPTIFSATYHLYSLIGVADYYLYSGNLEYLRGKWDQWKLALKYSLSTIDDSGMMNVTSSADWLRSGMGGHNIEANSIFYYTINQGIKLGRAVGEESDLLDSWAQAAAGVKSSANQRLWDASAGLYKDNETTTLHPQDGNSWAVVSGLVDSAEKMKSISAGLAARWGPYGAPAVEAADAVSPFISGFELQMHLLAGNASAAVDLMRLQWGFMLDDPRMTNSTFIEGYSSDGRLHYAPYTNDPRVSHAHGWATGPTSTLTFYFAGIKLLDAGGKVWEISPVLGGLEDIDAGFSTDLGEFSSQVAGADDGSIGKLQFSTPAGTMGTVKLPGIVGSLASMNGTTVPLVAGMARNISGGTWTLSRASVTPATGVAARPMMSVYAALFIAFGVTAFLL